MFEACWDADLSVSSRQRLKVHKFLQARSYDLEKATAMWMNNVAFRKEFSVDTILEDFVFEERVPFLEAYPQGYHKCDKLVCCSLMLRGYNLVRIRVSQLNEKFDPCWTLSTCMDADE
eukprot:scaffold19361_cov17-Tisochrysis_lutea.AAC.1